MGSDNDRILKRCDRPDRTQSLAAAATAAAATAVLVVSSSSSSSSSPCRPSRKQQQHHDDESYSYSRRSLPQRRQPQRHFVAHGVPCRGAGWLALRATVGAEVSRFVLRLALFLSLIARQILQCRCALLLPEDGVLAAMHVPVRTPCATTGTVCTACALPVCTHTHIQRTSSAVPCVFCCHEIPQRFAYFECIAWLRQ